MSIDSDWPIDTVLLVPPDLIGSITEGTGLTSMGTVYAGAAFMPANGDLRQAVIDGARWLVLDCSGKNVIADLRSALAQRLNVILRTESPHDLPSLAHIVSESEGDAFVVAVTVPAAKHTPLSAQCIAAQIRSELQRRTLTKSRIIIETNLGKNELMDYMSMPDIDGILMSGGDMSYTLETLIQLALNIQGGDWKQA